MNKVRLNSFPANLFLSYNSFSRTCDWPDVNISYPDFSFDSKMKNRQDLVLSNLSDLYRVISDEYRRTTRHPYKDTPALLPAKNNIELLNSQIITLLAANKKIKKIY